MKTIHIIIIAIMIISLGVGIWQIMWTGESEHAKGKVFVMYAGSLIRTFDNKIGPAFQNDTGYEYVGEGKGSLQIANMIIDGQRTPDVFISAGQTPMSRLLTHDPPLAHWDVRFASAEIVIAYSTKSPYFDDLEKARKGEALWYNVIASKDLKFGRTDPELDPKGYYTVIAAKLANLYYNDTTIKNKILGDDKNPQQLFPEETLHTALESGQLDAIVAYKHEAIARGLPYIKLPNEINLSDPTLSDYYKQASYVLKTGGIINGEPIYFLATIPDTSKNTSGAIAFLDFLFSYNGKNLLEKDGLNPISLVTNGDIEKIPDSIRNIT